MIKTSRPILIGILCALCALAGCQVHPAPTTIVRFNPKLAPKTETTRFHGEFRLYEMTGHDTDPPASQPPIVTRRLDAGQRLGFTRADDGTLVALAGNEAFPISQQYYLWQMRADPGQHDSAKTSAVITTVVLGTILVGGAIAIAVFSFN